MSLPRRLGWASSFLCLAILASLVATSAWLFGGVVPDHQFGFAAAALLAVAAGTAWVAGASVLPRVNGVVYVLGLAVALAVLQLVPLSAALRAALSPETARWQERLTDPGDSPSADSSPEDGRRPLSLYPESSRQDLARLLIIAAVFAVAAACLGSSRRQRMVCWVVAGQGTLLALFGVVQRLTFNGKLYWVVSMAQGGSPFGSFVNRNHAAAYFNLCLGIVLALFGHAVGPRATSFGHPDRWQGMDAAASGWSQRIGQITGRQLLLVACAAMLSAAVFASLSRGAVLSLVVAAMAVLAAVSLRRGARGIGSVLVVATLLGMGIAIWLGQATQLRQDLAELRTDWRTAGRGRLEHWCDSARMAPDVWRFGTGLGTYRFMYPLYETAYRKGWFYHAENQYLEAFIDAGLGGLCLMLAALTLALWESCRALRSHRRWQFCVGLGVLFSVVATAIHAAFDFNLYMLANGILLSLWTGMLFAGRKPIGEQTWQVSAGGFGGRSMRRRIAWATILLACGAGLCWSTAHLRHMGEVARLRRGARAAQFESPDPTRDLQHDFDRLARLAGHDSDACRDIARWLVAVFRRATVQAMQEQFPHSVNSEILWNATSLLHFHDRWQAARRTGAEIVNEAAAAALIQRHLQPAARWYQRARQNCPLQSENFLEAAPLAGILGTGNAQSLVDRAVLVAPQDPDTLFEAGLITLQLGDHDTACALWNRSLRNSADYLEAVLRNGSESLGPTRLVTKVFSDLPERAVEAAEMLAKRAANSETQALLLATASEALVGGAADDPAAQAYWLGKIDLLSGRVDAGITQLERALQARPLRHDWRAELATALLSSDRVADAMRHARISVHQQPRSGAYRRLLRRIEQQVRGPE